MTEISELAGRPVIIGGGAAGLATALALAPEPVVLLSKAPLGEGTSSAWAQGGMAATLGQDDEPQLHFEDTIAAGDGLCQPEIVLAIVEAAPAAIEALADLGVTFDRAGDGKFRLGLEAAHQRSRIDMQREIVIGLAKYKRPQAVQAFAPQEAALGDLMCMRRAGKTVAP